MNSESGGSAPRFGPIDPGAFLRPKPPRLLPDDTPLDLSGVPEFVSVLDSSGEIAGYVKREDLFLHPTADAPRSPQEAVARSGEPRILVVYDRDEKIVGHWIGDRGFVPLKPSP